MFRLATFLAFAAISSGQAPRYIVSTVVGSSPVLASIQEESPARLTTSFAPTRLTSDAAGNVYFVDSGRIRKLKLDGTVTSVAGNGTYGRTEDGRPAKGSPINPAGGPINQAGRFPLAAALDGSIYFLETTTAYQDFTVRRIDASGILRTVGLLPGTAQFQSMAVDSVGSVYLGDRGRSQVFKVTAQGGVSVFAGNGTNGFSGDGGLATQAMLGNTQAVAADSAGNIYIATDGFFGSPFTDQRRIRKVDAAGRISTYAGIATPVGSSTGNCVVGSATKVELPGQIDSITVGADGSLFLLSSVFPEICRISSDGQISRYYRATSFQSMSSVAVDPSGRVFVSFFFNDNFYRNSIGVIAGPGQDSTPVLGYVPVLDPSFGLFSGRGQAYFADRSGNLILWNSTGVSRIRNGRVEKLNLPFPQAIGSITDDAAGNLYFMNARGETGRLSPVGEFSKILDARINSGASDARGVRDAQGNFYFSDPVARQVFRVNTDGQTSPFAGIPNTDPVGYAGDGGLAAQAKLTFPTGLALDRSGNLYIADPGNRTIRKVDPNGIISTVAGALGAIPRTFAGEGGLATQAVLLQASSVAVDLAGVVYISDRDGIRMVTRDGIITTIAGRAVPLLVSFTDDDGVLALDATLAPGSLSISDSGDVYFDDGATVRRLSVEQGPQRSLPSGNFLNAASYQAPPLASGEFVTLFSDALANQAVSAESPVFQLGGLTVLVADAGGEDQPALLSYAAPTQVSFVVPTSLAAGAGRVTVILPDGRRAVTKVPLASLSPGVFIMGAFTAGVPAAQAVLTRPNNSQNIQNLFDCGNSPCAVDFGQPQDRISLVLYGTGFRNRSDLNAVSVTLGDTRLTPIFAGAQGQYPGLDQLVVNLPATLRGKGRIEASVVFDGVASNTFSLIF
ncbi:MAG: hypothetical protein ABI811_18740 [Acidobacteriota bacterium]